MGQRQLAGPSERRRPHGEHSHVRFHTGAGLSPAARVTAAVPSAQARGPCVVTFDKDQMSAPYCPLTKARAHVGARAEGWRVSRPVVRRPSPGQTVALEIGDLGTPLPTGHLGPCFRSLIQWTEPLGNAGAAGLQLLAAASVPWWAPHPPAACRLHWSRGPEQHLRSHGAVIAPRSHLSPLSALSVADGGMQHGAHPVGPKHPSQRRKCVATEHVGLCLAGCLFPPASSSPGSQPPSSLEPHQGQPPQSWGARALDVPCWHQAFGDASISKLSGMHPPHFPAKPGSHPGTPAAIPCALYREPPRRAQVGSGQRSSKER